MKRFFLSLSKSTCLERALSHSGVKCVKAFRNFVKYLAFCLCLFSNRRSLVLKNQMMSYLKIIFVLSSSGLDIFSFASAGYFFTGYALRTFLLKLMGALSMCFSWSTRYSLTFDSKAATEQMIAVETCDKYKSRSFCCGFMDLYVFSISDAVRAAFFAASKWYGVKFACPFINNVPDQRGIIAFIDILFIYYAQRSASAGAGSIGDPLDALVMSGFSQMPEHTSIGRTLDAYPQLCGCRWGAARALVV